MGTVRPRASPKPESQTAGLVTVLGAGGEPAPALRSSSTSLCGAGGLAAPASAPPSERHREGASGGVVSPPPPGSAAPVPVCPGGRFLL